MYGVLDTASRHADEPSLAEHIDWIGRAWNVYELRRAVQAATAQFSDDAVALQDILDAECLRAQVIDPAGFIACPERF